MRKRDYREKKEKEKMMEKVREEEEEKEKICSKRLHSDKMRQFRRALKMKKKQENEKKIKNGNLAIMIVQNLKWRLDQGLSNGTMYAEERAFRIVSLTK